MASNSNITCIFTSDQFTWSFSVQPVIELELSSERKTIQYLLAALNQYFDNHFKLRNFQTYESLAAVFYHLVHGFQVHNRSLVDPASKGAVDEVDTRDGYVLSSKTRNERMECSLFYLLLKCMRRHKSVVRSQGRAGLLSYERQRQLLPTDPFLVSDPGKMDTAEDSDMACGTAKIAKNAEEKSPTNGAAAEITPLMAYESIVSRVALVRTQWNDSVVDNEMLYTLERAVRTIVDRWYERV